MVLPKRTIEISKHAHHRAVSRFSLSRADSTATIRRALRQGSWYPSPETAHEYLVLDHHDNAPFCIICAIEQGTVHVRTLYPLRNTGRLAAYKRQGGPFSAREIATEYGLG